jgi:hypothetical protein
MTTRAKGWLAEWVKLRVTGAPYSQQKQRARDEYSPACRAAAERVGITRRELEDAANGSLIEYLEAEIENKWDIEVRKNTPSGSA